VTDKSSQVPLYMSSRKLYSFYKKRAVLSVNVNNYTMMLFTHYSNTQIIKSLHSIESTIV